MTERLHFHFPLSCIGEGKGNPLQCSCLENPRDGGAWWAAVYGVTQSRTRLKRLSGSSSSSNRSLGAIDWLENRRLLFIGTPCIWRIQMGVTEGGYKLRIFFVKVDDIAY